MVAKSTMLVALLPDKNSTVPDGDSNLVTSDNPLLVPIIVSPATLSALVSICTNESDSLLANAPPRVNLDLLVFVPSILSPIVISLSPLVLPILIFCYPVVTLPISMFLADPPINRP